MTTPNVYVTLKTSADADEDSYSDSDDCVYYNISSISPPNLPEQTVRPVPPPRKRQSNIKKDDATAFVASQEPTLVEDTYNRVRQQDKNYYSCEYKNINNETISSIKDENGAVDELKEFSWYWGDISRGDAEQMLKNYPDGTFLVRNSTTPGDYTLTVRKDGQSKCLKVYQQGGGFGLKVNECTFNSLLAFIEHYSQHTLADFNRRLDTKLISYPSKKPGKKSGNSYQSLSTLADIGRQLQKAKMQYIELKEQQAQYSKKLNASQNQERAYETARAMYSELLAPPPSLSDDFVLEETLSPERKEMLESNKKMAQEKHKYIENQASAAHRTAEYMELLFNNATIAMNDHVEVLRDVEENCETNRIQVLEEGAQKELVECLVEDINYVMPDRSLWMVPCSRDDAERYLQSEPTGTFLIRSKDEPEIPYALSIVAGNEDGSTTVKHCYIYHPKDRGYGFRTEHAVFESIDELVCKHSKTSIKVYFTHMDTCLDHPVFGERPKSFSNQNLDVENDDDST